MGEKLRDWRGDQGRAEGRPREGGGETGKGSGLKGREGEGRAEGGEGGGEPSW